MANNHKPMIARAWMQALPWIVVCLLSTGMWAQNQTSSGKLTVSATLQSSIGLVFNNDANVGANGYCPLSNAGTNNVGLNFGTASYNGGDSLTCVLFFRFGTNYTVTSGFDVVVSQANGASASYNLAAKIKTAPPANVAWFINLTQLTTAFATFQTANNYGQAVVEFLSAQVNQNVAAGSLNQEIDFQATAN